MSDHKTANVPNIAPKLPLEIFEFEQVSALYLTILGVPHGTDGKVIIRELRLGMMIAVEVLRDGDMTISAPE